MPELTGVLITDRIMLGPVMGITGVGIFGQSYAPVAFPVTVYLAHIAFGSTLGMVTQHTGATPDRSLFLAAFLSVVGFAGIGATANPRPES